LQAIAHRQDARPGPTPELPGDPKPSAEVDLVAVGHVISLGNRYHLL
jgi:hypothetical protein